MEIGLCGDRLDPGERQTMRATSSQAGVFVQDGIFEATDVWRRGLAVNMLPGVVKEWVEFHQPPRGPLPEKRLVRTSLASSIPAHRALPLRR